MRIFSSALLVSALALSTAVTAENLQATQCQIFVKTVWSAPSSHGSASFSAVVKVNWLGNGETIKHVGFYGRRWVTDLGNDPTQCHYGTDPAADGQMHFVWPVSYGHDLAYGDYLFNFPIASGTIQSGCRGYGYGSAGSFFVETDRNTYWVNPSLDSTQSFVFDDEVFRRVGAYSRTSTLRDDLRYYNPAACR